MATPCATWAPKAPPAPPGGRASPGNKRSIGLDWKNPKSRPVFEKLVRSSHVLVENFRAGVLERNNLGPDVLHQWNPDLTQTVTGGKASTTALHGSTEDEQFFDEKEKAKLAA